MMTCNTRYLHLGITTLLLLLVIQFFPARSLAAELQSLAVLLPDDVSINDPGVQAWIDAANEEGLRLEFIRDSQFLQLGAAAQAYKGIIVPDHVHQRAGDNIVTALKNYVSGGGHLMLVYDAGALTESGFYPIPKSRFSDLVGIDYVLYEELREFTIGLGPVLGMEKMLWELQVPPGKSMPFPGAPYLPPAYLQSDATDPGGTTIYNQQLYQELKYDERDGEHRDYRFLGVIDGPNVDHSYLWPQATSDSRDGYTYHDRDKTYSDGESSSWSDGYSSWSSGSGSWGGGSSYWDGGYSSNTSDSQPPFPTAIQGSDEVYGITGYVYGFLNYPSFVTRGTYSGTPLLTSMDYGLVAGLNNYGSGQVLFVNLPLSYLKGQTDGMLMHGFLRYFGSNLLNLPRLANQPEGRGGMVLNWHVDSHDALPAIGQLKSQGVWNRGPYSIHVTAGPDTIVPGDGLGIDVNNNSIAQGWIKYFLNKGHQIGSHGGWIHDYYGSNANEFNEAQFKPYLVMNKNALERVTGRPITEYSAPQGNNPIWAMNWLEDNGILGYYFAGHTGMGPTRTYRLGMLMNPSMWAFPVSTLGEYATFEEFSEYGVTDSEVTRWLDALVDFSVYNRTSRLIYFHPPGAVNHPTVMQDLMDRTDAYAAYGEFKWYTMTDLSRFMTKRSQTTWQVKEGWYGKHIFSATHPTSLAQQTWLLPKRAYGKPKIWQGDADVMESTNNWLIVVNRGSELKFSASPL